MCVEPRVIAGAVSGSLYLLVNVEGVSDGTVVIYSPTETGISSDGIALIALARPLRDGASIQVRIETADCYMVSCPLVVSGIINDASCEAQNFPEAGIKTGAFVCDGIDLTYEVTDGAGGYTHGPVKRADSIYCGGDKPNCEEEEE